MWRRLGELGEAAGAERFVGQVSAYDIPAATHVAGTCRMGEAPEESVVDVFGAVHGHPNLVIADANDAIGLGGVIGGANSEISENTVNVLLESATFDGANNRETAQALGLRTEATLRFEKGLRPELAPIALRRATGLIQEVAGGTVAPGIVDVLSDEGADPPVVILTSGKIKRMLGMEVDLKKVQETMDALDSPGSRRAIPHSR